MQSWADAEWFSNDAVPESIKAVVFGVLATIQMIYHRPKMRGRDQISPHARAMYKMTRDGLEEQHRPNGPDRSKVITTCPWPSLATSSALAHLANLQPTRCCGFLAKTFPACQTNDPAASASATRSHLFSLTLWKMQVHWSLKHQSKNLTSATLLNTTLRANSERSGRRAV